VRFRAPLQRTKAILAIDETDRDFTNAPKESDFAFIETAYHPKDSSLGHRAIRISSEILLETIDVEGIGW
jgi:hypothetical protein